MMDKEMPTPFAWATFDGEGSYDLRLYDDNESYYDEWVAANGQNYADWVIPLYEAEEANYSSPSPSPPDNMAALEMLLELEWAVYDKAEGTRSCPYCYSSGKHQDNCKLKRVLDRY